MPYVAEFLMPPSRLQYNVCLEGPEIAWETVWCRPVAMHPWRLEDSVRLPFRFKSDQKMACRTFPVQSELE
jgi:hypothetical protein